MDQIARIGMDTSKHVFQLHGVDAQERVILRRTLRRSQVEGFFGRLGATVVAIEASGGSHHWARLLGGLGHTVKVLPPQYVKAYVQRGKNDAADAAALCEAASRPRVRPVPVKSAEQQAAAMLAGVRERLVRTRTQLTNAIRGQAAEFGLVAAKGLDKIEPLLERIAADAAVPDLARVLFAEQGREYAELSARLAAIDARLVAWHRGNGQSRRLAEVPGIGPIGAAHLVMKVTDPAAFRSGRDFAAWLGLTPKDHSSGGKVRLGSITRAGDPTLRQLLVVGATSVIRQVRCGRGRPWPWLVALLARKPPKLAAVALANKLARIVWRLLVDGGRYEASRAGRDEAGPERRARPASIRLSDAARAKVRAA